MIDEKKIIYADLDPKEGVVLNLDTKNYYRLNETAQVIWKALAAGKNETQIADELCDQFEVTRDEALRDVADLLTHLKREQLR
jgi:hypothetical protein